MILFIFFAILVLFISMPILAKIASLSFILALTQENPATGILRNSHLCFSYRTLLMWFLEGYVSEISSMCPSASWLLKLNFIIVSKISVKTYVFFLLSFLQFTVKQFPIKQLLLFKHTYSEFVISLILIFKLSILQIHEIFS